MRRVTLMTVLLAAALFTAACGARYRTTAFYVPVEGAPALEAGASFSVGRSPTGPA